MLNGVPGTSRTVFMAILLPTRGFLSLINREGTLGSRDPAQEHSFRTYRHRRGGQRKSPQVGNSPAGFPGYLIWVSPSLRDRPPSGGGSGGPRPGS
jgi:hypothetical protein